MNPEESATDRELDQFYGTPPTEAQVQESIRRFTEAFDADDLQSVAYDYADALLIALRDGDFAEVGRIMNEGRKEAIAHVVSWDLHAKYGVITAKDIK